jgi:uncharacterized protein YpbB
MIEKGKCLMQLAVTVEINAKYHSSQKKTDLFIVENVSKNINQNEVVGIDLEADLEADLEVMAETEAPVLVEEMTGHEKCLMQNAEIVEMIAKYHSSQKKTDLFIAMNASKNTETISKLF